MDFAIVFLGAGIGGAMRHGVNLLANRFLGLSFPFATLSVNVIGSFAIALVIQYFVARTGLPQQTRLFLTTGILGGFTTFSAFSLDTVTLFERGEWGAGALYVVASVGLSLAAFVLAQHLMRWLMIPAG